jgi:Ribbon-helix-helix protein, copG family.
MEKRITLRLPQQMFNSLEKEARQTGMTISDAIRDRIKHSMDFEVVDT